MKQVGRPNGLVLSLDENTLYVGDVSNKTITKLAVNADGTIDTASAALFVPATKSGTVDGMCVDCAGNVYAGTDNGVEVYSATGSYIGTVPTGSSSNCTFGGAERKTLYVTSQKLLKYVTLAVPGLARLIPDGAGRPGCLPLVGYANGKVVVGCSGEPGACGGVVQRRRWRKARRRRRRW